MIYVLDGAHQSVFPQNELYFSTRSVGKVVLVNGVGYFL